MRDSTGEERRPETGEAVLLKVEYHEPSDVLADYLTHLGEGGMFIRTDADLEVGRTIGFSVSFPGLMDAVRLEGVVRFRREHGEVPGSGAGVGVEVTSAIYQDALQAIVSRLRRPKGPAGGSGPFRVLLVEDNAFVGDLFQHALERYHRKARAAGRLEVVTATDGQKALEHLESEPVDLAIVDHFLPVLSGVQIVERIRANERLRHIPVLVVSVGGEEIREEAMKAGADLFLEKPVLMNQLLGTLDQLLHGDGP